MGLFSSSQDDLSHSRRLEHRSADQVGVLPAFCVHRDPVTLKLQERGSWFRQKDYYINDINDHPIMTWTAQRFSRYKEFCNTNGQLIFIMKRHSWTQDYDAISPQDKKVLFTVKNAPGFTKCFGKARLNVTFINAADGRKRKLAVRGDFFSRDSSITLDGSDGPVIGTVSRTHLTTRHLLTNNQTYFLTVAPGVDVAMLAAICVVLDEKDHEVSAGGE